MAKKLQISFKETIEETELYNWVLKHSSYSGFVKDILKQAKEKEENADNNNIKTSLLKF